MPAVLTVVMSYLLEVFHLPLALQPSGVCPNAIKHLFTPSLLSICLNQFHLPLHTSQLISLISAISVTLLFVVLCCHLILSICLGHWPWPWKLFSFLSSVFVIFNVSQPYSRTGQTKVLNRYILVLLPVPLVTHNSYCLWNAPHAFCSLFLISFLPPPS